MIRRDRLPGDRGEGDKDRSVEGGMILLNFAVLNRGRWLCLLAAAAPLHTASGREVVLQMACV